MDYTTLVSSRSTDGSIKQFANKDDIPSAVILGEAEQFIYRRLRVRQMMAVATGTVTASATAVALPSRFIKPVAFWFTGTSARQLGHRPIVTVENWSYDGSGVVQASQPRNYGEDADNVVFDCMTDAAYPYRFRHYAGLAPLSGSNTTNFITDRAPRLVRAACLWAANDYLKNQAEREYWAKVALSEIEELNIESEMAMGVDLDARVEPC